MIRNKNYFIYDRWTRFNLLIIYDINQVIYQVVIRTFVIALEFFVD